MSAYEEGDAAMYRRLVSVLAAITAVAFSYSIASAHVGIEPRESTTGAFQKYTVRVPNEQDVPTVQVELQFPPEVTVSSFQPKTGWTYEVQRDASGTITGVIWSGGKISTGEFEEFNFIARNPEEPTSLVWKAYQTYDGGEVVAWEGPEGSDRPASTTTIAASVDGNSASGVASVEQPGEDASGSGTDSGNENPVGGESETSDGVFGGTAALWLSLVALGVGLVAAVISGIGLRRRTA